MKRFAGVIVFLLIARGAVCQDDGPTSVLLKYADAAKNSDAVAISSLMHPEALKRAREAFDNAFQGENRERARTDLLPMFAVSTYEQFADLSDSEVFRRLTETVYHATPPELIEAMTGSKSEVVGQVEQNDEVFITYTLTVAIRGQSISQRVIQRLKKHDGEWLLMLPASSEASIAAIGAQY